MKALRDLLSPLNIVVAHDCDISHLAIDSRQVQPGSLFFAYPGAEADGRDFIESAIAIGAAAVVYEPTDFEMSVSVDVPMLPVNNLQRQVGVIAAEFYDQPSQALQVFGVTGTNGKTTCCTLLVQAFEQLGLKAAMMGTLGAGVLHQLSKGSQTTPDPISVQQFLRDCVDAQVTQVCMEVSSHALDQGRVSGVDFYCTLFTNLSHDHLDYHGDMRSYLAAKQRLFADYPADLSVINLSDSAGDAILEAGVAEFKVSFGLGGDVQAEDVELSEAGISAVMVCNGVEFAITTPLVGQINVPNIELLAATLLALSTPVEQIVEILAALRPAPGRMELYRNQSEAAGSANVVVDYAHTPDALEKALYSLRKHCRGELWCVFGCGGDRDKEKRPIMGEIASSLADVVIVTNDNPRTEFPEQIAEQVIAGIDGDYQMILDRAAAIDYAIQQSNSGDWVLIAGKGHETTQEINGQILEFSDRDYVADALGVAA